MSDSPMMRFDDDFVVAGVLIRDRPPVKSLWVDLRPGLTVLYGVGGVGKTAVLNAVADALTGIRPSTGGAELHLVPGPAIASELGQDVVERLDLLRERSLGLGIKLFRMLEPQLWNDLDAELQVAERIAETWADVEPTSPIHQVELVARSILGSSLDLYHSPRIVLEASGSAETPSWTVGVSAVPRSLADAAERHEQEEAASLQDHDNDGTSRRARFGSSDSGALHASLLKQIRSQRDGTEWVGRPWPVVIGMLERDDLDDADGENDDPVPAMLRDRHCHRADETIDPNRQVANLLQELCVRENGEPDLIDIVADGEFVPSERLSLVAKHLAQRATDLLSSLSGEPSRLDLQLHDPNRWPTWGLARWVATDQWGRTGPVDELGSGMARLASLALSLVLGGSFRHESADVIIDEPERGLHSAAQYAAASSIERLCGTSDTELNVLVATHSPAFLGLHDAHIVRLDRGANGDVVSRPLELWDSVDVVAGELGITRSDLLLATRWIILVEGEQDASVLRTLFAEELRAARSQIIVMDGADNAKLNVARGVLNYSSAKVRLVLDGLSAKHLDTWAEAVTLDRDGQVKEARKLLMTLKNDRQREVEKLADAGLAALASRQLQRLELVGLSKPDVVQYLPVDFFISEVTTWDRLFRQFEQLGCPGGKGNFKTWVSDREDCINRINRETVGRAAERLVGDAPAELRRIVEEL